MAELPKALQEQLAQLQAMSQQHQVTASQRSQMEAMKSESEAAVQALEGIADDAPVYRSVGALYVREPGKKEALTKLTDDAETLGVRITRLQKQEDALRESMKALQDKIQKALPKQA